MFQVDQLPGVGSVDEYIDTSNVTPWDFVWAALILVVAFVLGRLARRWVHRFLAQFEDLPPEIPRQVGRLVFVGVMFVGVVYALNLLGFDTGPAFLLILFAIALLFLAGRPLLENFGSGIVLQARHAFRPGDQVQSGEHLGTVVEVNSRATVIETVDGKTVYIPNRDVLNTPLVNFTAQGMRRTTLKIGVEYGTDLRRAVSVVDEALADLDVVLAEPQHEVFVNEFGDSSIDLLAWYWHEPEIDVEFRTTDAVALAVKDALDQAGIVIAFPQRVLWRGKPGKGGSTYNPDDLTGDGGDG